MRACCTSPLPTPLPTSYVTYGFVGSWGTQAHRTQRIYGIYGPNNTVYRIYGVLSKKAVYHIPYIVPYPSPSRQSCGKCGRCAVRVGQGVL